MRRKKVATRKAQPGKYAGRSLFKVKTVPVEGPPQPVTPANVAAWVESVNAAAGGNAATRLTHALGEIERDARAILKRHGYGDKPVIESKPGTFTTALALPMNDPAGRAARILVAVSAIRRREATTATQAAMLAMYDLMVLVARGAVDSFAEPVLRDAARQRATRMGGRNKRSTATAAWQAATAAAVRALGRECTADRAWRWLKENRTPVPGGIVTGEGDALAFDGSDAMLSYNGWRRYLTEALAQGILRNN